MSVDPGDATPLTKHGARRAVGDLPEELVSNPDHVIVLEPV